MGGIKLHTVAIGGSSWSLNTLPADKGLVLLSWLGKVIGGPIASKAGASIGMSAEIDLGSAAGAVLAELGDPKTSEMIQLLLSDLRRDGKPVSFSVEFSGDYGTLAAIVQWALGVNFSSFFVGNPLLSALQAAAGSAAKSKPET